ncbi:hypothetical protein Tco_0481979, partial [Tanacetum coccineum]
MDDDDDDDDDAVEFIPPFEVDTNIYEFIPSLACGQGPDVSDVLGTLASMGGAIPPAEGFQRCTIPWLAPWLFAPWLLATVIEEESSRKKT